MCVWVGVGVAEAPQPHPLRSLCMSGGFQPMGSNAINPCYINPCFINGCFLSPVHVLPVQSLLYDVAHKSKIEITRENDGEGQETKEDSFPLPVLLFWPLILRNTKLRSFLPFCLRDEGKRTRLFPFPRKKNAGYYHFSLHNRKQALYKPNQSVVNMVNAAFCAKCETKKKESSPRLAIRDRLVLRA